MPESKKPAQTGGGAGIGPTGVRPVQSKKADQPGGVDWSQFQFRPFSLEDKPAVQGTGDFWTFDINALERAATAIEMRDLDPDEDASPELLMDIAKYSGLGMPYADEMRAQIQKFRHAEDQPEDVRMRFLEIKEAEWKVFPELIFLCKRGNENLTDILSSEAEKYCTHLVQLAAAGNRKAAVQVARIAIRTTEAVNALAAPHPGDFKALTADRLSWPVMGSPHPVLNSTAPDWEQLGIGTRFPFKVDKMSRSALKKGAGPIAWKLWRHVFELRIQTTAFLADAASRKAKTPHSHEDLAKCVSAMLSVGLEKGLIKTPEEVEYHRKFFSMMMSPDSGSTRADVDGRLKAHHKILSDAARLPEFTDNSTGVEAWWTVAEQCLISAYPHPEDPAKLNETEPALAGLVRGESYRGRPGKTRNKILEKLREVFYSLSGFRRSKG